MLSLVFLVMPRGVEAAQTPAEPFQVAATLAIVRSGEFESSDRGFGGRISWHPLAVIGLESEITLYPQDFPDGVAFSASRVEGLFGATVGPRLRRVRPFARLRAGFLRFSAAPQPFACIAIFPPPLRCLMASGGTRSIIDLGGGFELSTGARTLVRLDAGDRVVKYPGPSFVRGRSARDNGSFSGFFSHDLRFGVSGGLRF